MQAATVDPTPPVSLRRATRDEERLIIDSWARSFSSSVRIPRELDCWVWHKMHRLWIVEQLQSCEVLVAVMPDVPDEVIGWVCWEPAGSHPLALHYAYVKPDLRRYGVATMLVRAAVEGADERGYRQSHRTPDGQQLMEAVTHG